MQTWTQATTYLQLIGILIGQLMFGVMGDWIGRKATMLIDMSIILLGVILLTVSNGPTINVGFYLHRRVYTCSHACPMLAMLILLKQMLFAHCNQSLNQCCIVIQIANIQSRQYCTCRLNVGTLFLAHSYALLHVGVGDHVCLGPIHFWGGDWG